MNLTNAYFNRHKINVKDIQNVSSQNLQFLTTPATHPLPLFALKQKK